MEWDRNVWDDFKDHIMFLVLLFALFLCMALGFRSYMNSYRRIDKLEKQIVVLEERAFCTVEIIDG